jgi:ABC-type multidrug transport system ATPase subunit
MSEEILRALMELFALIVKQDGGMIASEREYVVGFLKKQLSSDSVKEYLNLFDRYAGPVLANHTEKVQKPTVVRDSVKIFGICRKINRTLNQEQKVVVLVRLFELVNYDRRFTAQRMNIIDTVAEVFKISKEEYISTEMFVKGNSSKEFDNPAILTACGGKGEDKISQLMMHGYDGTTIAFLRIESVEIYFAKYISEQPLFLNGLQINSGQVYSFAKGSTLKPVHGNAIYYSDVRSRFLADTMVHKLSFVVENLSFEFPDKVKAVDNISFSVDEGKLIGILGASGSGKTTLLNLMSGIQKPSAGKIKINGIDLYGKNTELKGVLGYVPQDDLLIEELTVYENLYYAACQCFDNLSKEEITDLTIRLLASLGLLEKKDLKVGSPYNKVISGGQRKRLNIALELIREPSILFLDEPTSGLSSRDSENLMHLLRDLTLKGKLVFNVIHQPSSEIFKMFDKVIILDQEGSMAYFGNPVDAVIYFKTLDSQINAGQGECPNCGNVNPETIFNIIETQVVDEFGQYTEKRKVSPQEWSQAFRRYNDLEAIVDVDEPPHNNLKLPGPYKQLLIYFRRDMKSKISNIQYLVLTLLEAPILGLLLSFLIRYIADPDSNRYIFAENENIPIYIFMTVIVAIFLGLVISAEEIFRDRKILKREKFLNLNRSSYLLSKILLLLVISAIQAFLFVITANTVLALKGLFFSYWLAFFATAFAANMLGLIISASFNSVVTIYLVIPLLIIPMMVLSGAMFPFDKLNRKIGNVEKVPLIAEFMPTRWTYEALMVAQFKDNRYSRIVYNQEGDNYYDLQKKISNANFNNIYRIPELKKALETCRLAYIDKERGREESYVTTVEPLMELMVNEIGVIEQYDFIPVFDWKKFLSPTEFDTEIASITLTYLNEAYELFKDYSNKINDTKDTFYTLNKEKIDNYRDRYFNYKLEEIVTKYYERNKVLIYKNSIIQNVDPIYLDPLIKKGPCFRTYLYAPKKCIFGIIIDTFIFNIALVFFANIIMFVILYYDLLAKAILFFEKRKIRK